MVTCTKCVSSSLCVQRLHFNKGLFGRLSVISESWQFTNMSDQSTKVKVKSRMQLRWKCLTLRQKSCRDTLWYFFISCLAHAVARRPQRREAALWRGGDLTLAPGPHTRLQSCNKTVASTGHWGRWSDRYQGSLGLWTETKYLEFVQRRINNISTKVNIT